MSIDLKDTLQQVVYELEKLDDERKNIAERKKEILNYAKKADINTDVLKEVMQKRKFPPQIRSNKEMLLHSYLSMLEVSN